MKAAQPASTEVVMAATIVPMGIALAEVGRVRCLTRHDGWRESPEEGAPMTLRPATRPPTRSVLERCIRYAEVGTQSAEDVDAVPSTPVHLVQIVAGG
jgi:hypothetical protein